MAKKNLSLILTIPLGLMLTVGLTGCLNSKPKPFEYKEWHDVQINEYGEKCTYHEPKSTEFSQKISNGFDDIVGGAIKTVLNEEDKCYTLAQWKAINQQAAAMMGAVNSFRSLQGKSSLGFSSQSSAPASTYTPSLNSNAPSFKPFEPFNSNTPSGYTNSFGNTYQYNLSNPGDRIRYNSDPGAQLRDRVTPNPYKDIESNTLQQGGGIYPTDNSPTWIPVE